MPGGISPGVVVRNGYPVVLHETGTGRLSWVVHTEGVTLTVSRASGPVLTVSGDADDWCAHCMGWLGFFVDGAEAVDGFDGAVDILPRHVEAVEHALGYRCTDREVLQHVAASAGRELDRAREALREAGEGLVKASVDLAHFMAERPKGGAS